MGGAGVFGREGEESYSACFRRRLVTVISFAGIPLSFALGLGLFLLRREMLTRGVMQAYPVLKALAEARPALGRAHVCMRSKRVARAEGADTRARARTHACAR